MPTTWGEVPPDHPLFTGGVSFVFKDELPDEPEADEHESDDGGERGEY